MTFEFNIQDDKLHIRKPISEVGVKREDSEKVDSGESSIEKSKSVKPEIIPLMSIPILRAPSNTAEDVAFVVTSVDATGRPTESVVYRVIFKVEEIKNNVLKAWAQNLREIEEHVRQLLSSPYYRQLQEVRLNGDAQLETISGVQGTGIDNRAVGLSGKVNFLSTLDRLRVLDRLPPTAEIPDPSAPQDSSRVLMLPIVAALLAGGFVVGTEMVQGAHPLEAAFEVLENLQPIFPQVAIQDLFLVMNLMVVSPIYIHSWNEAVGNIKDRKRHSYVQTAQNFAKDVIKMVTDANFVKNLISSIRGTNQLFPQDQDRLSRMLKVVLIGVALSLLYSVEVGKVQDGKFGGIEPEELRDLILGKWHQRSNLQKKMNLQERLILSLIDRSREQLAPLSIEDRSIAVNMLLEYVTKTREIDPMLDPAKLFNETLSSSSLEFNDKISV
jgi:hypothetical protein